jgi:hypothetical protein
MAALPAIAERSLSTATNNSRYSPAPGPYHDVHGAILKVNNASLSIYPQTATLPKCEDETSNNTSASKAIKKLTFLTTDSKTSREIHDQVYEHLEQKLTMNQAKRIRHLSTQPANEYLYIFECMDYPGLYKIGLTTLTVSKRKSCVHKKCHMQLREVERYGPIVTSLRAEQLCHDLLRNYQRKFACPNCRNGKTGKPVKHREYFMVPLQLAKAYANMSTTLFKQMPYLSTGFLKADWAIRLQELYDLPPNEQEDDDLARLGRWNSFACYSGPANVKDDLVKVMALARASVDANETEGFQDVKAYEDLSIPERDDLYASLSLTRVNTEQKLKGIEALKQLNSVARVVNLQRSASFMGANGLHRSFQQARKKGSIVTATFKLVIWFILALLFDGLHK